LLLAAVLSFVSLGRLAQAKPDYPLGTGDAIRVQVLRNPDLTIETRLSEKELHHQPADQRDHGMGPVRGKARPVVAGVAGAAT
jgi:protein involved in polysaccharide export with SLBB domain